MPQQVGPPISYPTSDCRPSPEDQQGALCGTPEKISQTCCLTTSTSSPTLQVLPSLWWAKGAQGPPQFSSVAQSCPTLYNPMNRSTPGLPIHHQLPEFTQTQVGDDIQPSHLLSSPSPAFNLSQHQGFFKWVSSSHQVAKGLEFHLQRQSFQWTPRTDLL